MNFEFLDSKSFSSLNPQKVQQFLLSNGWSEKKVVSGGIAILENDDPQETALLRLPLDASFADFAESMGRLVKDLSISQNRSPFEVLEDLNTVGEGDVVRLSTFDPVNRASTSIPLIDGVELIEQAKRITTAAALSTKEKRPVFNQGRSPEVSDYLHKVRLGQTEAGSYKIKLISPLPLQPQLAGEEWEVPFERLVITNLMDSLYVLREVSTALFKTGNYRFDAFVETVPEGVSANLCEALITARPAPYHRPLNVSVTWSNIIQAPHSRHRNVEFDPNILPFIEKAAREFRERNPENVTLRGFVLRLEKPKPGRKNDPRKIVIFALVDDKYRSVHVNLENAQMYDLAIDAHKQGKEVFIDGVLKREGLVFHLDDPTRLRPAN